MVSRIVVETEIGEVKAVIFDLDETLIDAQKGLKAAHEAIVEELSNYLSFNETDFSKQEVVRKFSDFDDRMNKRKRYDRDRWWPKFVEELGFDNDLNKFQVENLTKIYWRTYADNADPYPDTAQILNYLKKRGYLLGLVTDTDGPGVKKRDRISKLGFSSFFDSIVVGGDDTEESKPDPEPFKLTVSQLNLESKDCVMVGDKPFTDIKGAKSVGMKTILVKRREWESEEQPNLTVGSLSQLKRYL